MSKVYSLALLQTKLEHRSRRDEDTGCLEWVGARHSQGYGRMWNGERLVYTHRTAYEVWIGPIPSGEDVLHRCDNTRCIEPKHLWSGTHRQNMMDRDAKGRGRSGGGQLRGRPSLIRGSAHPRAIIKSAEQARAIFKDRRPAPVVAAEYGVKPTTVYAIQKHRLWAWATEGMTR